MPIRIVKDNNTNSSDSQKFRKQSGGGGSSGGGLGGGIVGALLPFLFKRPKLLLILGGIVLVIYLIWGGSGVQNAVSVATGNGRGCDMSEEVYDEAEVFEPLADNAKNPLPNSISLEKYCPPRLNQGAQGSCVGWSSAYAARTILESRATGQPPQNVAYSPSFLYNQIALRDCQGSYIQRAMEHMAGKGALPFSKFGYNDQSCSKKPTSQEVQQGMQHKMKGFNRLSKGGDDYKTDLLAIKQNLAQNAPVVIGMMVGGSFMEGMKGKKMWKPTESDFNMRGFGGHAMCVVGYDDYMEGGAFQIMNSWGADWGDRGFFWIRYNDFDYFTREAYGLYPMGNAAETTAEYINLEFGLVDNANGKNIALQKKGGLVYTTDEPIAIGTKFKIEVTNSQECYTYVFGEETDGSCYVLFPYTQKHSPYCGITGTRLFPKDYSMQADDIGSRDKIAVVISKQPLDYNKLNEAINASRTSGYEQKIADALSDELETNVEISAGQQIKLKMPARGKNAVAVVLEIEKR